MVKVKEDMTGWIMKEHGVPDSKLIVIKQAEDHIGPNGNRKAQWWCKCDCGSEPKIINQNDLKHGRILSCGCLLSERTAQSNRILKKKYNKYDLSGEYGIGWTSNTNREFYFDLEDYDKIYNFCWSEVVDGTGYHYLASAIVNSDKSHTTLRMHSLLTQYELCDHKDRNPFNNRKQNLRDVSDSENAHNTSGIIGVSWFKRDQYWVVSLTLKGVTVYRENFNQKQDAIIARLKAELKYFGPEFAPQRHLFKEYGITLQNDCEETV